MTDVVIIGTGVAGLYCALNLPDNYNVLLVTKATTQVSDSYLAQGGICMLKDEADFNSFFMDTLRAGHFENNPASVHQMITKSQGIIKDLIYCGVEFEKKENQLQYTREGAHSVPRILYHKDITGQEITTKLIEQVKTRKNITILEETEMIDLICSNDCCQGVILRSKLGIIKTMKADYTVLATGGIGGLYQDSTNYPHITGDSLAIALKHNINIRNINYIQIHPTTLYSKTKGRRFLISESLRGEGAYLLNGEKKRFVNELLPRDLLTKEIYQQMKKEGSRHVWLSLLHLEAEAIRQRFPTIYQRCLEEGIDIAKDCIPVTPAQHYFMGGIDVDLHSKTSIKHLYAVGETSCNGVHGANRLASNSLLESLVFAKEAANHIANTYEKNHLDEIIIDATIYNNFEQYKIQQKRLVLNEIARVNQIQRVS